MRDETKAVKILALLPALFVLSVYLSIFPASVSAAVITDDASGGDCSSIGVWDVSTKTCTLTQDLSGPVIVSGNNITLDGAGHSISTTGPNTLSGILVNAVNVTTIRNVAVFGFERNVRVFASNDTVIESVRSESALAHGANVDASNNVAFTRNTFANNAIGVAITRGSDTLVFTQNNFLDNGDDIQKDTGSSGVSLFRPLPEGGNYWSRYDAPEEGCNDTNTDGFCDAPYSPNTVGIDQFPWTTENGWVTPPAACSVQESTVFYINGIDTKIKDANDSKKRIIDEVLNRGFTEDCVTFDLAYNSNEPLFLDFLEGGLQKAEEVEGRIEAFWETLNYETPLFHNSNF